MHQPAESEKLKTVVNDSIADALPAEAKEESGVSDPAEAIETSHQLSPHSLGGSSTDEPVKEQQADVCRQLSNWTRAQS